MLQLIAHLFASSLHIADSDISNISRLGGMSNQNYLVKTKQSDYVARLPGAMTDRLISRENEAYNSMLMSEQGLNVKTLYFNEQSGFKITQYLPYHLTLNHHNIGEMVYLKRIAEKLYDLHSSQVQFHNTFNVFDEFEKYIHLLNNQSSFLHYHQDIPLVLNYFEKAKEILTPSLSLVPCHNDLVPENILFHQESMYFIDWEYSGMNDPLFDIAAFLLESRLSVEKQELFLNYYFKQELNEKIRNKIKLYQFTQDVLWFVWTLIKEENNEFFGGYGEKRIKRALNFIHHQPQVWEIK